MNGAVNGTNGANGVHPDLLVLPHSLEAERAVLGSVLIDPACLDAVGAIVQPGDFYRESHACLLTSMLAVTRAGRDIDTITVADDLRRLGVLDIVGGLPYLAGLLDQVPSASNVAHYAKIVKDCARRRTIIGVTDRIRAGAYADICDADTLAVAAAAEMGAATVAPVTVRATPIRDVVQLAVAEIGRMADSGATMRGTPCGLTDLDRVLGGFEPGHMTILAARPSMGKTALGFTVARGVADAAKRGVLFVSLEMSAVDIVFRMLAAESSLDATGLRNGKLDRDGWPMLFGAASRLSVLTIAFDDRSRVTAADVRSLARTAAAEPDGLGMIVVDYLQLLTAERRVQNREREIAEISAALKAIAKDLGVHVLALAQLNRECDKRPDKRPLMSDLRDSGGIEQDADRVAFIYRDEVYNPNTDDRGVAEILVRKNRHGAIGVAKLAWQAAYTRFGNLAPDYREPPPQDRKAAAAGDSYYEGRR